MSEEVGITTATTPDSALRAVPRNVQEAAETQSLKKHGEKLPEIDGDAQEDEAAKAEILTITDIEIRKLHALRRTKEFLEQKIEDTTDKKISAAELSMIESESAVAIGYNHNPRGGGISVQNAVASISGLESDESGLSYKTAPAISGYRNYKKETPKAWEEGAMDEKR